MDRSIVRIAILSDFTTEFISSALKEQCDAYGLEPIIYNPPFNHYAHEALSAESGLTASMPDMLILMLEGELLFPDWYEFVTLCKSREIKQAKVSEVFRHLTNIIDAVHSGTNSLIVVNNFRIPSSSPLGILDSKYDPGLKRMVAALNENLEERARSRDYMHVFDYNGLFAKFGEAKAADKSLNYLGDSPVSLAMTALMAKEYLGYLLPTI